MSHSNNFHIEFNYTLTEQIVMNLEADVELHCPQLVYEIKNIIHKGFTKKLPVLPDIKIQAKKINGSEETLWVHADSGKETILSKIIGEKIASITKPEYAVSED